ncbi:MAG: UvrB/UvrC motif-containing protein [Bacillota bacterium]
MLCEICGQAEATVHITRTVNGETKEMHLCPKCAAAAGHLPWTSAKEFPVGTLFGGLLDFTGGSEGIRSTTPTRRDVCPTCGSSYESFRETGFLGCTDCYDAFADVLEPLLKKIHGDTIHRGKRPVGTPEESRAATIERLREELQRSVELEEYERAAEIRDEIKRLEGEE